MDDHVSFCFLGSKSTGKTILINKYIASSGINKSDVLYEKSNNLKNKNKFLDKISFEKKIKNINFKLKILEMNEPIKHYDYIKNTEFIFLIFDILNRSSYEDIVEIWKDYLMDKVNYSNKLFLLGNYYKEDEHMTEKKEIEELIESIKQEKNFTIDYFEIGNLSDEKLMEFLDDKILKANNEKKKTKQNHKDDNSGSCMIF